MKQQTIDFSAAERFSIVREFAERLPTHVSEPSDQARRISSSSILSVLRAIVDFAGDGRCWASVSTIAMQAGISERHARRCIRWLDHHGLIAVRRQGNRQTNELTPVWQNLRDVTTEDLVGQVTGPETAVTGPEIRSDRTGGQGRPDRGSGLTGPGVRSDRTGGPPNTPLTRIDPTTTTQAVGGGCGGGGQATVSFVTITDRLRRLGVASPDSVLQSLDPSRLDRIEALIDWYEANSYIRDLSAGALVWRLRADHDGLEVDDGWPPDGDRSEERRAARARAREAERLRASRRRSAEESAARDQALAVERELERRYGDKVDRLSSEEAEAIILRECGDFAARQFRRNPRSKLFRDVLISVVSGGGHDDV